MIPMSQLQGLSYDKAGLFGMPHLGCEYTDAAGRYHILDGERCVLCSRRQPLNAHHAVFRSVRKVFVLHGHELRSPLICLCGSGTQGCHGAVHSGRYKVTWRWDSPADEDAWWSGELLDRYGPHSDELFRHGCYVVEDRDADREILLRA